jgi:uncharacterized protein YndB with AHSA1/START domain
MPQGSSTIEQKLSVNAPASRVYRALTDASELVRWFPSEATSDARPGGAYDYKFLFADTSRNHQTVGQYRETTPNKAVSYSWPAGHANIPTEVAFSLAEAGSGTEVTLRHTGWTADTAESMKEHDMGWGFFLQNLKSYLESGQDQRSAAMGMKTAAAV